MSDVLSYYFKVEGFEDVFDVWAETEVEAREWLAGTFAGPMNALEMVGKERAEKAALVAVTGPWDEYEDRTPEDLVIPGEAKWWP